MSRRAFFAVLAAGLVLCLLLSSYASRLRSEQAAVQSKQAEMELLRRQYDEIKSSVDAANAKKPLTRVEGVVQAVDEVFRSVGLTRKLKTVKPSGTREHRYAREEEAEVQAEKLDMNEAVNLLYRIENSPMMLSVRKTTIKTAFENPAQLNLTINVSFVTPK